ncbi:MAG: B12-binding domain-containing radical SAM protein [Pelovirga sp.]
MRTLIVTQHVRRSAQAVPLAAACLCAALPAELRRQTEIIDLYPDMEPDLVCQQLLAYQPQLIGFSLSLWNRSFLLAVARRLRSLQPQLLLIGGGPETAGDCQDVIRTGQLDGVIRGEGEIAFATLLNSLIQGRLMSGIEGFVSAAAVPETTPPATCPDLSVLPSPWLTGVLPLEPGCGVLWEVARGCHFNCSFCYDAKGHQGVRPFPLERLHQELEFFVQAGVAQIWILDSTFNAPARRGHQLLHLLIDTAPDIHYHIEAKADLLDNHTIELLSQLSCSLQIGLQSARPDILKPLQRHINPQQVREVLQQLNHAGIVFGLDLIYGLPGDNHQGFRRSLDFALEQQPNQVDIFPLAVLPGTELHRRRDEFGLCAGNTPPYLIAAATSYPPEQIEQSQLLAAATDLFYNRGRAVGFFLLLCDLYHSSPATLLQQFGDWLMAEKKWSKAQFVDVENRTPDKILPWQRDFCREQCRRHKHYQLIPLVEDLLYFHYLCAEILLGDDCCPAAQPITLDEFVNTDWQLHPAAFLHFFHYDPLELETSGGESLTRLAQRLQQAPGQRLLLRVAGEMVIEALDDSLAQMLQLARARQNGKTLLDQLEAADAEELALLVVEQGLLLPAT